VSVARVGFKLNWGFSNLSLLGAEITGVCYHSQFTRTFKVSVKTD
jgi:hypothetical protein